MLLADDEFDRAFRRRCPAAIIRAETETDAEFLVQLFIACSPLASLLPQPMLRQQALIQQASHQSECPRAMRRIILLEDATVARFVIDWSGTDCSHAVDIAVMPNARKSGIGRHLLHTWLEVADALNKPCRLEVLADNPARRLYDRLGFRAISDTDRQEPVVHMERPVMPPPIS